MSKIYVFGVWANVIGQVAYAENLSLNKALDLVRSSSREVAVAQESVTAAERQIDVANTGYWPKVNAESRAYLWHSENGYEQSTLIDRVDSTRVVEAITYDLTVTYPMINAGTTDAQKASAVAQRDAARSDVDRVLMMNRAAVIDLYFTAVQATEKAQYYESLVTFVSNIVERIRGGVKVGAFTSNEILSLGATVSRLKSQQNNSELVVAQSVRSLKQYLGIDEQVSIKLTDGIRVAQRNLPTEKLRETILQNNPGRKAWLKRIEAIDEAEWRELSFELPKLDLQGRYGTNTRYAGVVLSVPIFSGFSYHAKKGVYAQKRAQARLESARYEDTLRVLIDNRIDTLKKASRQADQLAIPVKETQRYWKRINAKLKSSGSDMLVWKAALEDLVSSETSMISELASYRANMEVLKDWALVR